MTQTFKLHRIYLKPLHLQQPIYKRSLSNNYEWMGEWNSLDSSILSVNCFILFKSIWGQIGRTERVTFCYLWNSIEQLGPNSCSKVSKRIGWSYCILVHCSLLYISQIPKNLFHLFICLNYLYWRCLFP